MIMSPRMTEQRGERLVVRGENVYVRTPNRRTFPSPGKALTREQNNERFSIHPAFRQVVYGIGNVLSRFALLLLQTLDGRSKYHARVTANNQPQCKHGGIKDH